MGGGEKVAWYPLFAHARAIPEILCELVRLWTSYTCCYAATKLDIRLAVWQLCLRGDGFHYQRHDKDYGTTTASFTVIVLVVE